MLMRYRNGSSEFHPISSLKDWSAVDIVGKIEAETLVNSGVEKGRSDEAVRPFVEGIRNVEWIKLKRTTDMPHGGSKPKSQWKTRSYKVTKEDNHVDDERRSLIYKLHQHPPSSLARSPPPF
jgi:hypothetical protein